MKIQEVAEGERISEFLLQVEGEDFSGNAVTKVWSLKLKEGGSGRERIEPEDLFVSEPRGEEIVLVDRVGFGSHADRPGLLFNYRIERVRVSVIRPDKE
ncbi:DUF3394 domain-containing protein [Puniceicoccus vermicola]|uniref:DUF3394 domain-containing protein n=1 Tax=Puniceicoccus vermicola TaxID=388746 RepID=A0A7X1E568_9BACT|nr:DUF3394 domain-containing protein [Puniceicoccus vermicola]MBC2601297.1 DUF3394 domain-containing protein [Puniceicoccus vermicola]